MPDSFFTSSKTRKRKRSESSAHAEAPGKSKKFLHKSTTLQEGKKKKVNGVHHKPRRVDEELSDRTEEGDGSGVDDMDLRAYMDEDDPGASGEEDENETPAEKRLRLAQLYLDSVKVDLGECPQKTSFRNSNSCFYISLFDFI
jgi:ribosomal RNA-processing protein 9